VVSVNSGSQTSFTVTYTVPSSAASGSNITTTVSIDSHTPLIFQKRAPVAITTVSVTTTITRFVHLVVTKSGPDLVAVGSVAYNVTVTNLGPSDAANVTVVDTFTSGVAPPTTLQFSVATLPASKSVSQIVTQVADGTSTGVAALSNVATASSNETRGEAFASGVVTNSAAVVTAVGPLEPSLTFSAFRTRNSWDDSDGDDDDHEHCTQHDHSAERCTRLFFVELANTDSAVRADNIVVDVVVANVALAEALLTQSSRSDSVANNGQGSFTWTIPTLQPGARARIALKVRVVAATQQIVAHVLQADACLPRDSAATCALFPVASVAGPVSAPYTLSKVF